MEHEWKEMEVLLLVLVKREMLLMLVTIMLQVSIKNKCTPVSCTAHGSDRLDISRGCCGYGF